MNRLPYAHAGAKVVAIYARVSTAQGQQDATNQLIQLRDYCTKAGWTIYQEYVDHVSGKSSDRAQFKQLFKDASKRKFDVVLFWSLDRFSREGTYPTLMLLQRLDSYGVGWKSLTEEYLDSCGIFKDAVIAILATVAKQERLRISERVKAGIIRVRAHGRATWGRRSIELKEPLPVDMSLREAATMLGVSKTTIQRRRRAL